VVAFGDAPRNIDTVRMDHMNNWISRSQKRNEITERVYLQFTAEFFNLFNHVRFGAPNEQAGNPSFGIVTSQVNPPRAIQFGLRVGSDHSLCGVGQKWPAPAFSSQRETYAVVRSGRYTTMSNQRLILLLLVPPSWAWSPL